MADSVNCKGCGAPLPPFPHTGQARKNGFFPAVFRQGRAESAYFSGFPLTIQKNLRDFPHESGQTSQK
jgi:hypothetical protein